ncbi:UNVERIFIED_CONTAM: hypothetical protein PYX00_002762 [Menopon gallinae]|uniref:Acyltransferase n=1 Tax=Menopon gallinae TaxID=328185 RepID=A0AAW2HXE5_9NEOP
MTIDWAKYVLLVYLVWMYVDRNSCIGNKRRWTWMRDLPWWRRHKDYFPIRLLKTCDLPPDRNYIFALCPHGVFSFGAMTSFVTDALDFREKFPGLKLFLCTLNVVFQMPILREFALGQGFSSVSEESLNEILDAREKGQAAGVVIGGAAEAALSSPNRYKILLSRRKGFCKVALKNGADIVPVYSFGESDLYYLKQPEEGSLLHEFQILFKKLTTIFPVVFYGVGPLPIFPRRIPVTVTVGKPITVKKVDNPTKEDIDELHGKFRDSIVCLFNEYKGKYLMNKDAELVIC